MKTRYLRAVLCHIIFLQLLAVMMTGCSSKKLDAVEIEYLVRRYNDLVIQGYRNQNMNPMQEVTTREHALKLYHHMSALGEGRLRMESRLKDIRFKKIEHRDASEAIAETEEIWDFAHYRMDGGEKYAEEKDFIYRVEYVLQKKEGRWVITQVTTISGTSTNPVIPWPAPDRKGNKAKLPPGRSEPAMQQH